MGSNHEFRRKSRRDDKKLGEISKISNLREALPLKTPILIDSFIFIHFDLIMAKV